MNDIIYKYPNNLKGINNIIPIELIETVRGLFLKLFFTINKNNSTLFEDEAIR